MRSRVPLLFLVSDTGGGHRRAAIAVAEALEHAWPGRFAPNLYDPLMGPSAPRYVRSFAGLYGPLVRYVPLLWGALYHASDSPRRVRFLWKTLLARASADVAGEVARSQSEIIVSFHPLLTLPAAGAARAMAPPVSLVTVVTDTGNVHSAWTGGAPDLAVAASHIGASRFGLANRCVETGLPVPAAFCAPPPTAVERAMIRHALGLDERRFVVVVAGGGEGSGHMARDVRTLLRAGWEDLTVVAICGHNSRLRRRLERHPAAARPSQLVIKGWVADMPAWLRASDLLVTKAGPGTLAEAACAGVPLVVTSRLPGQEEGNADLFIEEGAAIWAGQSGELVRAVDSLLRDRAALDAMRASSARLALPGAASEVAALLAQLAGVPNQRETVPLERMPA